MDALGGEGFVLIEVIMRGDKEGRRTYVHEKGVSIYTQDHWLYIVDNDGLIIACHPEMHVETVQIKAGETTAKSENTN